MRVFIVIALLLIFSPSAFAQESRDGPESPPTTPAADTRIDVDQDSGTVTIVVKGRPVAIFDEGGLHVRGDVAYGGVALDYGAVGFDKRLKAGGGQ